MSLFRKPKVVEPPAAYLKRWYSRGLRWYITRNGIAIGHVLHATREFVCDAEFERYRDDVTAYCTTAGIMPLLDKPIAPTHEFDAPAEPESILSLLHAPSLTSTGRHASEAPTSNWGRDNEPGAGLLDSPYDEVSIAKGIAGERQTAIALREQLGQEWYIVNSVPVLNADRTVKHDIDHIVIGPGGIFCVDSKVLTGHTVRIDGRKVSVSGGVEGTKYWGLAMNQARAVTNQLSTMLMMPIACQPVLAFQGLKLFSSVTAFTHDDWVWFTDGSKTAELLKANHKMMSAENADLVHDAVLKWKAASMAFRVVAQ